MSMSKEAKTKLIVGLGNPGKDYKNTRHNIGFEVLDLIAFKSGLEFKKESKFEAELASASLSVNYKIKTKEKNEEGEVLDCFADAHNDLKLILVKPTTYMNNSGRAVQKLAKFYKIPAENILVVQDDVTLDAGKLRMAFDRGAGGQHGIEDIIACLGGTKKFHRIKLGVGPDPGGDRRSDYVLATFPKKEKDIVEQMIYESYELALKWLTEHDPQQIKSISVSS
ncbi:MAG: aminoacyl-tRNA hydrolase [Candidatus Melainabacteria bacterium]|nr:aminoacyl-tRNA hydrolase [Candidatus Melainabacteria bacterium]